MATIYDLIEVTDIRPDTTYSKAQGNVLGVVDGVRSSDLDDGEFDEGDSLIIDGAAYTIDLIEEPSSSGRFTLTDGTNLSFDPASESNLSVAFLTVSNGTDVRYFIVPNDSYGDMAIDEIRTGSLTDVAGSDAAVISLNDNSVAVVCFAQGTLIAAPDGRSVPVEELRVGDQVLTLDHAARPITWVGAMSFGRAQVAHHSKLRPVVISASALAPGVPDRMLRVSQQHRLLLRSKIAERMFGANEVLVPAKQLIGLDGIALADAIEGISYHHFMCDGHEIVFANRAPCESLFPGPEAMKTLTGSEVSLRSPQKELKNGTAACRILAKGARVRKLVKRHRKNGVDLYDRSVRMCPAEPDTGRSGLIDERNVQCQDPTPEIR